MFVGYPKEEIYINKPIQDNEEMSIICKNDQGTGSFVRIDAQSSRSLGAHMEPSLAINLDNKTFGFDEFDDVAPTQPPTKVKLHFQGQEGEKMRKMC